METVLLTRNASAVLFYIPNSIVWKYRCIKCEHRSHHNVAAKSVACLYCRCRDVIINTCLFTVVDNCCFSAGKWTDLLARAALSLWRHWQHWMPLCRRQGVDQSQTFSTNGHNSVESGSLTAMVISLAAGTVKRSSASYFPFPLSLSPSLSHVCTTLLT